MDVVNMLLVNYVNPCLDLYRLHFLAFFICQFHNSYIENSFVNMDISLVYYKVNRI